MGLGVSSVLGERHVIGCGGIERAGFVHPSREPQMCARTARGFDDNHERSINPCTAHMCTILAHRYRFR